MNEHDSINMLDEYVEVIDGYFSEIETCYEKEPDKAFVSLMQASILINQILSTFTTGLIRRASQSLQAWLQK